ncbi:solute carrier family 40 member 1-like isoform X2 [Gigantopelta aegis]|uniref:solute carrier family 40 member 1-like isoform X2 n=1 Tax=Gigantopelta aegis TaxID=1735272 RepID=UPI001B88C951|nr:solute carrier family 40 member 1-like isoform X2 [Gigantopelta aegis]
MASVKSWFTGTNVLVYSTHFLSAWGDRMWSFGIGLFLIGISPDSLQLTAIYGLSRGISVLLFGAIVGDWVDNTPRLKVAQLSLVLQNVFVVLCAGVVYAFIMFKDDIAGMWDDWLQRACYAVIILLSILSNLFSIARVIAVERDWIVEICGRDKDKLAHMTSSLRRIDLSTKIVAPIATGQIMTYAGLENGALFIGSWNLVSVFVEYFLVWKVYNAVPALKKKKDKRKSDKILEDAEEDECPVSIATEGINDKVGSETEVESTGQNSDIIEEINHRNSGKDLGGRKDPSKSQSVNIVHIELEPKSGMKSLDDQDNKTSTKERDELDNRASTKERDELDNRASTKERDELDNRASTKERDELDNRASTKDVGDIERDEVNKAEASCWGRCCRRTFHSVIVLFRGWRTYVGYDVSRAGLGLAFLYMTVLGFDNITVGYAYSQGITESVLGMLMAVSALIGIAGTIVYPFLRRKIGPERTGLFALSSQNACLLLCVVSVWMPGSPFDPFGTGKTDSNCTVSSLQAGNVSLTTTGATSLVYAAGNNVNVLSVMSTVVPLGVNTSTTEGSGSCESVPDSYLSIGLLMAGIMTARFGLWLADLAITQVFLENVIESERGVVNGVQSSLNQLMDMLKFAMVVAIPVAHLFGFLILVSFAFVICGALFYASYSRKARGHLFHFEKCVKNNNKSPSIGA